MGAGWHVDDGGLGRGREGWHPAVEKERMFGMEWVTEPLLGMYVGDLGGRLFGRQRLLLLPLPLPLPLPCPSLSSIEYPSPCRALLMTPIPAVHRPRSRTLRHLRWPGPTVR